jgi:hypothetical protein
MSIKMCRLNAKNDPPQSERVTEHCDANNSRMDDTFQARVLLLQSVQPKTETHQMLTLFP